MLIKVNRDRAEVADWSEVALVLVVIVAILFCGYGFGVSTEHRKMREALEAEKRQHQRTAADLKELRADMRVVNLCDHIRRHTTIVPEICR